MLGLKYFFKKNTSELSKWNKNLQRLNYANRVLQIVS